MRTQDSGTNLERKAEPVVAGQVIAFLFCRCGERLISDADRATGTCQGCLEPQHQALLARVGERYLCFPAARRIQL